MSGRLFLFQASYRYIAPRLSLAASRFVSASVGADVTSNNPVVVSTKGHVNTAASAAGVKPQSDPYQTDEDPEWILNMSTAQFLATFPPESINSIGNRLIWLSVAKSLTKPGRWNAKYRQEFCEGNRFLAALETYDTDLVFEVTCHIVAHLPTSYTLTISDLIFLQALLRRFVAVNYNRNSKWTVQFLDLWVLRQDDIARSLGCMRHPTTLMDIFYDIHVLFSKRPSDAIVRFQWVVLGHVQTALSKGSYPRRAVVAYKFSRVLFFDLVDHPQLFSGLTRYFTLCLHNDVTLFLDDCGLMATLLSTTRYPAKDFFQEMRPVISRLASEGRMSARNDTFANAHLLPYFLTWAYLAQGVDPPKECIAMMNEYPPRPSGFFFSDGHDFVFTLLEQITVAIDLPCLERLDNNVKCFRTQWVSERLNFFRQHGVRLFNVRVGKMRLAMAALVTVDIDNEVHFQYWPKAQIQPHEVTRDNISLLGAIPVAYLVPYRFLHPTHRLSGPDWMKASWLRERGWAVASLSKGSKNLLEELKMATRNAVAEQMAAIHTGTGSSPRPLHVGVKALT